MTIQKSPETYLMILVYSIYFTQYLFINLISFFVNALNLLVSINHIIDGKD